MGEHDPSACLVTGGEIVAAVEEERFTRNKWGEESSDRIPVNSIRFVLDNSGQKLSEIDILAVGWDPSNFFQKGAELRSYSPYKPSTIGELKRIDHLARKNINNARKYIADKTNYRKRQLRNDIRKQIDIHLESNFRGKIIFVPHHRSHAASAYYCSGFDNQVTITADGGGEHDCTVLWSPEMERIKEFTRHNSIGHMYSSGAEYLGYTKPSGSRHAGKVMGLAPYGNYREEYNEIFDRLVDVNDGSYDTSEFVESDVETLESLFGERHTFPDEFEQRHKDFAFHLQKKTEEILIELVEHLTDRTGVHNLSVAGGVFMNCKMNKKILECDCVDDLFIQPASHDAGVAIGAALEAYNSETGRTPKTELTDVYLGPRYDAEYITNILDRLKIPSREVKDVPHRTAELLADGKLVGWYQGRMEFGPRALGNRSILASPRTKEALYQVNKNVKYRESWRPFAPSLLYEAREEYLENGVESPFMIMTDSIKEQKHDEVPAIVHVDGTARPQTVRKEQNPKYYDLLENFGDITGTPVLLNTSFNVSGEPIVKSPKQAIEDFYTTGLDVLVLGDRIITKADI